MDKRYFLSLSNPDANPLIIKEMADEMETVIRCPYCGEITTVGHTVMISGFVGCDHCYWQKGGLRETVMNLKENNYEEYLKGNFYKKGYKNNVKWRTN